MKEFSILVFEGANFYLSNFYNAPVMYEGILYQNNEAAFQSAKTLDMSKRRYFAKLNPSDAKKEGRRIKLREDWEHVKFDVMYQICLDKFQRNEELRKKLLSTKDAYLVEGNTWHDNCWGNCHCQKCIDIPGDNLLGQILMKVREELR